MTVPASLFRVLGSFSALVCVAFCLVPADRADAACPNADIRAVQGSADLPDCRAWEKVTPVEKNNADIGQGPFTRVDVSGATVTFEAAVSFAGGAGAPRASNYRATRSGAGWAIENISPSGDVEPAGAQLDLLFGYRDFSSTLGAGVFMRTDDAAGVRNLYRRDFASGAVTRLTPDPRSPLDPAVVDGPRVGDVSGDVSHVVYESMQPLTADAPDPPGGRAVSDPTDRNAYEWTPDGVRLVGVLPDGSVAPSAVVGRGLMLGPLTAQVSDRTMSQDGSRIYFTVPDAQGEQTNTAIGLTGEVYLRVNGQTTVHVSASQRTDCAGDPSCGGDGQPDPVTDPDGPGKVRFMTATPDGSRAFLASCRKLTDDARASCDPQGYRSALYRFDLASGRLQALDTTVDIDFYSTVGISDDGSRVYWEATTGGVSGLYTWSADTGAELVGDIASGQANDVVLISENMQAGPDSGRSGRVSPDGRFVVWLAGTPGAINASVANQLRLYDAQTRTTTCLSCRADGSSHGTASIQTNMEDNYGNTTVVDESSYRPRAIDLVGQRVFFESTDALVPEDVNGKQDVYEYDLQTGKPALLSSGQGSSSAWFADATPDGSSVFIVTGQRLVAADRDDLRDLYVARTNGGSLESSVDVGADCDGDGCQGPLLRAPDGSAPGSTALSGAGNAATDRLPRRPVRVTTPKPVYGTAIRLKVTVPDRGLIRTSGAGVQRSYVAAQKAKAYLVPVRLSKRAIATLRHVRRVRVPVSVRFTPSQGKPSTARVSVTFRLKAKQQNSSRSARRATVPSPLSVKGR